MTVTGTDSDFLRTERSARARARAHVLQRDGYACRVLGCDVTADAGDDGMLELEYLGRGDVIDVELMATFCAEHAELVRERKRQRRDAA